MVTTRKKLPKTPAKPHPKSPRPRRRTAPRYPVPGPEGGRLIREVIGLLRSHGIELPFQSEASHILIATSGGADSMALAHLLIHYGRRVGDRARIRLLHIDHGWRAEASAADARFVRAAARRWKVPVVVRRIEPPGPDWKGQSWEDVARTARKRIYADFAARGAVVLTAHHGDDLAETLLWRLLTGSSETHGGGIAVRADAELRPLLGVRKQRLIAYLKEEGESWREDSTNAEGRFLRSRMRRELLPAVETLFPRAIEHLIRLGLRAQQAQQSVATAEGGEQGWNRTSRSPSHSLDPLGLLFSAAGLRVRRAHWDLLRDKIWANPSWTGVIHLPGRWTLKREYRSRSPKGAPQQSRKKARCETWVLECTKTLE